MTLKLTQHHVADHNWLRDGVKAEAVRLATPVDIGGPYHIGDPAHIQEHNRTTLALDALATAAGCAVTLPPVRQLGDKDHISDHLLWEAALAQIQITEGWNDATGGTVTEYSDERGFRWRLHTFTSSSELKVTRALRPFRAALVGGGGDGAYGVSVFSGGGGGGGAVIGKDDLQLSAGTIPVVVGTAAAASSFAGVIANPGGAGVLGQEGGRGGGSGNGYPGGGPDETYRAGGGGGAGGAGPSGCWGGGYGGTGLTIPIVGGTAGVGGGGGGNNGDGLQGPGYGGGGGGGKWTNDHAGQTPGRAGLVVVAYQVAPYNQATGGAVTEYEAAGKRYRVHTFTGSGTFTVEVAAKPFRTLVVAGGGGGGSNNYQIEGGFWQTGGFDPYGGSGGRVVPAAVPLVAGAHVVTVGEGGRGGLGANNSSSNPPPYNGGRSAIEGTSEASGASAALNGTASDITGAARFYGGQGQRSAVYNPEAGGSPTTGAPAYQSGGNGTPSTGGGGGSGFAGNSDHGECGASGAGGSGVVIISYEIGKP